MRVHRIGAVLLAAFFFSGCTGVQGPPSEEAAADRLSIAALFQTESGEALQGGAACFSGEAESSWCQVGGDGRASVSGLPREGEMVLTLFDQKREERGAMTLLLERGAVMDATTGEDGVGHVTVRDGAGEVALIFVLMESGGLQCSLCLAETVSSSADPPRKGV